ncbi:hypothetical protein KQX54_003146 [Cotesia glomerata]|uniref:Uncharacterized protein n=1 Tax=Cotesia glomerata TaxID=32391 RepID=A0AAV7IJ49_COTGL|nr:hypothetical protein KQX54_003146 [Cotesia glomerata]
MECSKWTMSCTLLSVGHKRPTHDSDPPTIDDMFSQNVIHSLAVRTQWTPGIPGETYGKGFLILRIVRWTGSAREWGEYGKGKTAISLLGRGYRASCPSTRVLSKKRIRKKGKKKQLWVKGPKETLVRVDDKKS